MFALTHITTMLLFRRLLVGGEPAKFQPQDLDSDDTYWIPVKSLEDHPETTTLGRLTNRTLALLHDLPLNLRRSVLRNTGITKEIYTKFFNLSENDGAQEKVLLLCNPSGETIETLSEKAISLARDIGYDTLVMFDYRPTGRSCKGVVAPDTTTMLEDAESVLQWLITVKDVSLKNISVAGISLGGLQAIRLAIKYSEISRLILINTFSSFSCIIGSSASLLPSALRIGGVSSFLPNMTTELKNLQTAKVAVISVENDERIPQRCTEELVSSMIKVPKVLHLKMQGTHSSPEVNTDSLNSIREFIT